MTGSGVWMMAAGVLARDPERRQGSKSVFAVATIRVGHGDGVQWVSTIAFGATAERLLELHAGDGVSVAGRAEVKSWTGKGGAERSGLSVIATEIAATRPRPRSRADDQRQPQRRWPQYPRPSAGDPRPFDDRVEL